MGQWYFHNFNLNLHGHPRSRHGSRCHMYKIRRNFLASVSALLARVPTIPARVHGLLSPERARRVYARMHAFSCESHSSGKTRGFENSAQPRPRGCAAPEIPGHCRRPPSCTVSAIFFLPFIKELGRRDTSRELPVKRFNSNVCRIRAVSL